MMRGSQYALHEGERFVTPMHKPLNPAAAGAEPSV